MPGIIKKYERRLATKSPPFWVTRLHVLLPVFVVLFFILRFLGSKVPLTVNGALFLILLPILTLILLGIWARKQFLYLLPEMKARAYYLTFLISFFVISLSSVLTFTISYVLQQRTLNVDESYAFRQDEQGIRIAMIPEKYIRLVRKGAYTQSYLMNVRKRSFEDYLSTLDSLKKISENNFVNYYFSSYGDFSTTAIEEEKSPDFMEGPIDTVSATNSSILKNTFRDEYFLESIEKMTSEEIDSIKQNVGKILRKYDFAIFDYSIDGIDSIFGIERDYTGQINKYFDLLNREYSNMSSNEHRLGEIFFVVVMYVIFILCQLLSQLLLSPKKKVVITVFALIVFMFTAFFYCLVIFRQWIDLAKASILVLPLPFILIFILRMVNFIESKKEMKWAFIYLLNHLMAIFTCISAQALIRSVFPDGGHEIMSRITYMIILISMWTILTLWLNIYFIRYYHKALHLPG